MLSQQVIAEIRTTDKSELLSKIYIQYREEFICWLMKKHHCSLDDATEIYQNVILIFYENILNRKIEEIRYDLKTYLFTIGKNKVMELKRRNFKVVQKESFHETVGGSEGENDKKEILLQKIEKKFEMIGDSCQKLLKLYYYEKKTIREITRIMGYKNEATTKNQKYKCMEKLRKLSFAN